MNPTDLRPAANPSASPTEPEGQWDGHIADDNGATFGPEPMARLSATRESLRLTGPRGDFRLPRDAIRRIGRGRFYPWLFAGVRFDHTVTGIPRDLQFKPLRVRGREVLRTLRLMGYPVP